jgi:hypothetical protein
VGIGADGRALLHCHAYDCDPKAILDVLGLGWPDLVPPGHRHARRRQLMEGRRPDFQGPAREVVNVLAALEAIGSEWMIQLRCDCPYCGAPAAVLFASSWGVLCLSCPGDPEGESLGHGPWTCTLDEFKQALAGRVQDRRAAA